MNRVFHYHPLASYCHKALIGLYDCGVPFEKHSVDLGDAEARAALQALNPLGKMPVLVAGGRPICETSIILEAECPQLFPSLEARYWDRFFDLYVHVPMQKIVGDRLRPEAKRDPYGVDEAKASLLRAYAVADQQVRGKQWVVGDDFTVADCAAGPPLFFANKLVPFARHEHLAAYFDRLAKRPSYARVLEEMMPYLHMFPG